MGGFFKLVGMGIVVAAFVVSVAPSFVFSNKLPSDLEWLSHAARAQGKNKIAILITGSSWCPSCQKLDEKVIRTEGWESFAKDELVFELYDYPAETRSASPEMVRLLDELDIKGFPTMIVADDRGRILGTKSGFHKRSGFEKYRDWIREL